MKKRSLFAAALACAFLVSAGPMLMYIPYKLSGKAPTDNGICPMPSGDSDFFAADGSPSECLKGYVNQTKGTMFSVVVVDSLWGIAQRRDKAMANEAAWQSLAKNSVQGIAVWDWPLYVYESVPFLNRLYSPEGSVACVKTMAAGHHCGIVKRTT